MPDVDPDYGVVSDVRALGRIARGHRKRRRLTLETVSGLGNLSPRFLSEFERGKETAEIGKVLKALSLIGLEVVVQPRGWSKRKQVPSTEPQEKA
ncbi:transcriptional regulator [Acidithiobacillus caldus]|uniref:helix-turn-helix domain-containing protein n=1 Tax=Acidithiobacillus caldus TaxID=33059 RepID=UPI0007D9CF44|nr:helix-turn-helix transcriptional regulator [Acidithiobacillus caldus]AUW32142.1 transcriptional regulator [Acidithiobacillus caldus]QER45667.1 Helix-turn-helix motif [Acidithiobacillus caldus]